MPRQLFLALLCAALTGAQNPAPPPSMVEEEIGAELWEAVLSACVLPATVDGMLINAFDYAQLTQPGGSLARASFDAYIGFLAALPAGAVDAFSPRARKALLINAYNALAVKVVVDHFVFAGPGAMASIKDINDIFSTVWTSTAGSLAGAPVSLDDVEKGTRPLVGLL
jgi:hypothetical protein